MTWALVLLGGAVGAPVRYLIDRSITNRHDGRFPWGTLAANLVACALLGFVASSTGVSPDAVALLGIGIAGALSTYSTFAFEIVRLAETGAARISVLYALSSVTLGIVVASLAGALGRAIG